MEVTSVCVNCQNMNKHEVDNNGQANVTCKSCSTEYKVQSYEVRAKGGQRDRKSGIKHYNIRVKEPDRDERMLEFDSDKEIEMRSGDWITGSYLETNLKYLLNQKINRYWDVQPPPPPKRKGCLGGAIILIALFVTVVGIIMLLISVLS